MAERRARLHAMIVILAVALVVFGFLNFPIPFIKFSVFAIVALWILSAAQ